jgi:hypothetical protein
VALRVLTHSHFDYCRVTYPELHADAVHEGAARFRKSCRRFARLWLFCHTRRVHCRSLIPQGMCFKPIAKLHKPAKCPTMQTDNNYRKSLVTEARATIGLLRNEQRPTPGEESVTSFSGVAFLVQKAFRCYG